MTPGALATRERALGVHDSGHRCRRKRVTANVIDVADSADPRLDDFRDLNSVDRRPDLPSGKGLVIAEGVLVVQRMLASRFRPRALLGTDRRLGELADDLASVNAPYYRVDAEVMAEVVGFHLNRGVLASAPRAPELTVAQVLDGACTVVVLEGINDHETSGRSSATPRAWASTQSCLAWAAPTPCTGAPFGCRWAMPCWSPTPGRRPGRTTFTYCGTTVFGCWP
jgi:hypothetical protein